jgi:hypothetical protein
MNPFLRLQKKPMLLLVELPDHVGFETMDCCALITQNRCGLKQHSTNTAGLGRGGRTAMNSETVEDRPLWMEQAKQRLISRPGWFPDCAAEHCYAILRIRLRASDKLTLPEAWNERLTKYA